MLRITDEIAIEAAGFASYFQTAEWGGDALREVLISCRHYLRQTASLNKVFDLQVIEAWLIKRVKESQAGGREFFPQPLSGEFALWDKAELNYVPPIDARTAANTVYHNASTIWFEQANAPAGYDTFVLFKRSAGVISQVGVFEERDGDMYGIEHGASAGDDLFVLTKSGLAYSLPCGMQTIS